MDTDKLFSSLSTFELVALHNTLGGGKWLGQVRRALNLRVSFLPTPDREEVRRRVGAYSWDAIYPVNR